jgi:hypothetical protein
MSSSIFIEDFIGGLCGSLTSHKSSLERQCQARSNPAQSWQREIFQEMAKNQFSSSANRERGKFGDDKKCYRKRLG